MDDLDLRTVELRWPQPDDWTTKVRRASDAATWLNLLEQVLELEFPGYQWSVSHDSMWLRTQVKIVFSTIEDATLFKLKHRVDC